MAALDGDAGIVRRCLEGRDQPVDGLLAHDSLRGTLPPSERRPREGLRGYSTLQRLRCLDIASAVSSVSVDMSLVSARSSFCINNLSASMNLYLAVDEIPRSPIFYS